MLEVYAFLFSALAQQQEAEYGQQHTYPLIEIEPLAKHEQRAYQYQHGAGGVDGTHNGDGQVFHAIIAKSPTGEHDDALHYDIFMQFPST